MTRWTATIAAAAVLSAQVASAEPGVYLSLGSTTTTTVGGGFLGVFLVIGREGNAEKADAEAATTKASLLYLRDNHLQLVQDLARGEGPILTELAAAAGIRLENRAHFSRQMQSHAKELIGLSAPEALDGNRTLRFVERCLEIVSEDAVLAQDLASARS